MDATSNTSAMRFSGPPFWEDLARHGDAVAFVDAHSMTEVTYLELASRADELSGLLAQESRELVFLFCDNDAEFVVAYIAVLRAGHAVLLLGSTTDTVSTEALLQSYRPEWVIRKKQQQGAPPDSEYELRWRHESYEMWRRRSIVDAAPNPRLKLLLTTSASTGNPKLVRHSDTAVATNALQIVNSLRITPADRAVASLPVNHVYGLSVINSHLAAGASVLLQQRSLMNGDFWREMDVTGCTALYGVSFTFECMQAMGIRRARLPGLRKLAHSGDKLGARCLQWIGDEFAARHVDIFLMYGQTEACGRMTVLPPDDFGYAPSVGLPVAGADVDVVDEEIVYSGPNVMMGYATQRACLCKGDELAGRLQTGDRGIIDANGMLRITGRTSRICKVQGRRIELDDLEKYFGDELAVAVLGLQDRVVVFHVHESRRVRARGLQCARAFSLPPQIFDYRMLPSIPRLSAGKVDYRQLRQIGEDFHPLPVGECAK